MKVTYRIKIQRIYTYADGRKSRAPLYSKTTHHQIWHQLQSTFPDIPLDLTMFREPFTENEWAAIHSLPRDYPKLFFTIEEKFDPANINYYFFYKSGRSVKSLEVIKPNPPTEMLYL